MFIVFLGLCIAAAAGYYTDTANLLSLYIVIPFIFLLTIVTTGRVSLNVYIKLLIILFIWIALSCIWANYPDDAFRQVKQIIGTFLVSYIFAVQSIKQHNIPYFYIVYLVLFVSACIYAYNNILSIMTSDTDRLSDEKLNANTLAYLLFYCTFSIYLLGEILKSGFWNKMFRVLFFMTIPITLIISFLTASRQVLIIQIPLIIGLLFIRYIWNADFKKKILYLLITVAVCLCCFPYILQTYENSYLKERNEMEITEDSRFLLLKDGIRIGVEHLPFGVGANNYIRYSFNRQFSHNTYVELFANEGIIGLLLYVSLMWIFIKRQIYYYKRTRNRIFIAFLIFGIGYIIDGFFYVFYPHIWLMSFFILVASHSQVYYKNLKICA